MKSTQSQPNRGASSLLVSFTNGMRSIRSVALAVLCAAGSAAVAQVSLPADVQTNGCTLTPAQFANWFQSGKVSLNGAVVQANSLLFQDKDACAFYQWAFQMFLWLTSPTSSTGGRVFDSPTFYNVSVADANGVRTLIPNSAGAVRKLGVRTLQAGKNGKALRTSASGEVTEVELGQAGGGGVLVSQGKSLVYYTMDINDVYAWLITGATNNNISPAPTTFPANMAQILPIISLANGGPNNTVLKDANALTIELKTSWVEASTVDASRYVTMTAEIPTYNTSSPTNWVPNGAKQALLALVGVHIVGSVNGHPEMVWATFEHVSNSPNGAYSYVNNKGQTVQMPASTAGKWVFCASNSTGPFNTEDAVTTASGAIVAASSGPIVPSNTQRVNPWGGSSDATNNSQIISLNRAVLAMLPNGDVRRNYLLGGATWTDGTIPTNNAPLFGSHLLANSTMETYNQALNCFVCHAGPSSFNGLSHIFSVVQPLLVPPPPQK